MLPPEDYDLDFDDTILLFSLSLDEGGNLSWQIDRPEEKDRTDLTLNEVYKITLAMHAFQQEMYASLAENYTKEIQSDAQDFKVDEELE